MRVSFHNTNNLVNLGKLWCCCSWFFLTTFLWAGTTASRFTWTGTCTGRPGTAPWTVSLISINNVVLKSMLRTPPLGLRHHFAGSLFGYMFRECKRKIKKKYGDTFAGFRSQSRGIWLEPEPSLWPGSGSTLIICLIIHENYMELNIIWCLF